MLTDHSNQKLLPQNIDTLRILVIWIGLSSQPNSQLPGIALFRSNHFLLVAFLSASAWNKSFCHLTCFSTSVPFLFVPSLLSGRDTGKPAHPGLCPVWTCPKCTNESRMSYTSALGKTDGRNSVVTEIRIFIPRII